MLCLVEAEHPSCRLARTEWLTALAGSAVPRTLGLHAEFLLRQNHQKMARLTAMRAHAGLRRDGSAARPQG